MIEQNIKIAVIGSSNDESRKMSLKLSEYLGIPLIYGDSAKIIHQHIYKDNERRRYTSNEIYTVLLAQFHSRIKKEKVLNFVSDGSVLDEVVSERINTHLDKNHIRYNLISKIFKSKFRLFERKVESVIYDYVKTAYDKIYILNSKVLIDDNYSSLFKRYYIDILDENNIDYNVIEGNFDTSFQTILNDIHNYTNKLK